ncbi:MAG TPA: hypothetical protein VK524_32395 [Polyangiaceae bacterium]|nr:hypothetical protein [Polyangiaceae bacterium]
MGTISVIQGAALQNQYRALVLARGAEAKLTVKLSAHAGIRTERVRLARAGTEPLRAQLRARGLAAYQLSADRLLPERSYRFHFTDGRATASSLDTYTLPAALPREGTTIAVASCYYRGFNMGARLATSLRQNWLGVRPLLQFWVGDNLYADVPSFGLFSGNAACEQTLDRYLEYFEHTAYGSARALTPNYTTYDDHEFWNNFPEPQPWLMRSMQGHAPGYTQAAHACLDLFQSSLNPPAVGQGRSFRFDLPPLSCFFLDVRSARTRYAHGRGTLLAPGDVEELQRWARELEGPGVLALGQPLWALPGGKTDYTPAAFTREYRAIWAALVAAPFDVLTIAGDVHHSRLLELTTAANAGKIYEFVSSPASHIPSALGMLVHQEAQVKSRLDVPRAIHAPGAQLKARYFFGTRAPNSIGLLRFVPRSGQTVDVDAAFIDYGGARARIAAPAPIDLPPARHRMRECKSAPAFTLGPRRR